ncbi:MAG TPA: helix-turn-helix domain-containing protein, partial [Paludibacter sp.]
HLLPDFIIADLRMPEMDGLQLTVKVREDKRTSHIPIILLTAVTDMESKVAGMKAGADDYITKPFNSAFLHARIENLMNQRNQLQQFYRSQIISSKPDFTLPPLEIRSQEDLFMQHLIKIMNENLENFDLNIDLLATDLNMSRTVFFNKLKSLTGYSPVEFVREVRFERAAEYIRDTQLSVSEVSYKVGIEDPRYFSRCFKQKFGATPSEYRLQQNNLG